MRKSTIIALFATVALPFGAYAQDNANQPAGDTPPPAADSAAPTDSGTTPPASDSGSMGADSGSTDTGAAAGDADKPADSEMAKPAAGDAAKSSDMAATEDSGPFVTVPPNGAWRATDLEGKDVYDTQGESIGEITDVLVSEDGKVMAVLVGVGGFLGIGEKDVAVSMSALEFGPGKTEGLKTEEEANAASSAASGAGGTGMAGGTAGGATAPAGGTAGGTGMAGDTAGGGAAPAPAEAEDPVVGEDNLPDRIVLNVSRDQLEKAPAYGEPEDEGSDDAASSEPASGDASQPATEGSGSSN